jgi:hypothetical protein
MVEAFYFYNNTVWLNTISNFLIDKMFQYRILFRLNICMFFFSKIKCFNLLDMEYILVNWVNRMSFLFWLFFLMLNIFFFFLLAIVLSVFWFPTYDYPFGFFKLFLFLFHTLVVFMYTQRWEVIVDIVIITVQIKSWGGVPLTDLTSLHFCACPKPGPGFTTSYVMVFLVFSELRWDVIVHFFDIVGIVNHHCLNYLFIKSFPFKF